MASVSPEILLLSIQMQLPFEESYSSLVDRLSQVANLKRAKTRDAAFRYLGANHPKAILVTDEGLMEEENEAVLGRLKSHLRNGGRVIIGFHFTIFANWDDFNKLLGDDLGLRWKSGNYYSADLLFNPFCTLPVDVSRESFPSKGYRSKVLHIEGAHEHEKILHSPDDKTQAGVVGVGYGGGFLFYNGDANSGKEFDSVIMALCGF
ncbi:hypothetical protein HYFRA_00005876 [Hymenoscyphus fraxineus]|uniref:Uncharacterized protein n=1 Tax=Hymenoscyphus fraxineus TaxID=746836 RepID=A0A9N9KW95_9HELO|nr:hypothetical protein HYFRA_00005876 [Hymenoscyphus fraxineus]